MVKKIIITIVVLIIVAAGVYGYVFYRATSLPGNNPNAFVSDNTEKAGKKIIVCLGDSITHGAVSCNYVDELSRRLESKGYILVNAGINTHLAYNALLRVKEVASCKPDFVTVLIGTNDANATMSKEKEQQYIRDMNLPQIPDKDWYRENLRKICRQLKTLSNARIALLSIPPMGEDRKDAAYIRAKEYGEIVKQVAGEEGVAYLALFERMDEYLKNRKTPLLHSFDETDKLMYQAIIRHYLFGSSYNDISKSNGFMVLTDFLHLNCTGADMVADLIEGFVTK